MAVKFVDQNSLVLIFTKIKENFVQKETGKELISSELLTKLGAIEAGAQVNVLEGVQVNGSDLSISGKKVNVVVPTTIADLGKVAESDLDTALATKLNNKADKATTLAGYGITDAYTGEVIDKKIADALAAATGGESAADVKVALENYQSANDARVKAIEDDYLTSEDAYDDTALAGRVTALESLKVAETYETKADATSKKTALETAISDGDAATLASAKEYADGKNTAMDTRVQALETAIGAGGSVETQIDAAIAELDLANTYDAKGAAATAEANAKAYADGLNTTMDGRVGTLEEQITGLTGAMHFKGVVTTDPTTITEGYENGDVVVYGEKEYVWNNGAFVLFGDVSAEGERIGTLETKVSTIEKDYMKTADLVAMDQTDINDAWTAALA